MTAYEVFLDWLKQEQLELNCDSDSVYSVLEAIKYAFYSEIIEVNLSKVSYTEQCVVKHNDKYIAIELLTDNDFDNYKYDYKYLTNPDNWSFVEPYQTVKYK